jgi:hypothetical protein
MAWRKLGLVVSPAVDDPLRQTHAILPTPISLNGAPRVYFGSCDGDMRGRIFYADLDRDDPTRVRRISAAPVLDVGQPGAFDADGVNPSTIVESGNVLYMFYVGYERRPDVPYTLLTGLAVSDDGGESFHRISTEPLLAPAGEERYVRTAAYVTSDDARWRMWYIGGGDWIHDGTKQLPIYSLRHLASDELSKWTGEGEILLAPDLADGVIGFGRPWVTAFGAAHEMLISVRRTTGYRLVSGRSGDGLRWSLGGEVLPTGPERWDSEMVCYGATLVSGGDRYLVYNGNRFGSTGFGIAIED